MRKRVFGRQLGRTSEHRWAMLRNMVTSLIKHERIVTTTPKAKMVAPFAEKLITHAKIGTIASRQHAGAIVREKPMLTKLFGVLGPRYSERSGGYTRILKVSGWRKGDGADMSVVEFVDRKGELRPARAPQPMQVGLSGLIKEYQVNEVDRIEKLVKGEEGEKKKHPGLYWLW